MIVEILYTINSICWGVIMLWIMVEMLKSDRWSENPLSGTTSLSKITT
jgi:hypothetical protein